MTTNKDNQKYLKVTYIKSVIGYGKRQEKILAGLGFNKLNQTKNLPDNECVRGSIFKIKHLLRVEEL